MFGLFVVSAIVLLSSVAHAGCAVIGGQRVCASWITGGSEVGMVTGQGFNEVVPNASASCPGVTATQGFVDPVAPVTLELAGTKGTNCGLGDLGKDDTCDIRGVVFCGPPDPPITLALPLTALSTTTATSFGWADGIDNDDDRDHPRGRRATTRGPMRVRATDQAQLDGSDRNFSGFRFQLDVADQQTLCPGRQFITFIAKEGFFEACVNSVTTGVNTVCVREQCTLDVNGLGPDDPRVYRCQPVS